ncbi:unnamed protein product [Caenorhabditis angaria]|uniref:NADP-dependent oxidoreductase domain-containing protein n=1 Tax=Caenorhabditis angaria TaxID=860376 RepID=A0A9P1IAU6_9PELO|nr:unnamed protein product [Caenorhabditis angaria]
MVVPNVHLSSGYNMPIFGLGTWQSKPGEVAAAVRIALEAGYRHIDCAFAYQNQKEIGEVLTKIFAEGKIKREEVFITSKVWNTFHSFEQAKLNIQTIINDLELQYIDLLLIHWPQGYEEGGEIFPLTESGKMRYSNEDYLDTWKALEEAQKAGKVRSIGISNFNHKQIERLWNSANIKPSVLQVELHPFFQQQKLRDFCKAKNIAVTAYSPLGNPGSAFFRKSGDPDVLTNEVIGGIAKTHGKTAAQVTLRWFIEHGIIVIPKSISENRIKENFNIFDFQLTPAEVSQIDGLNKNWRLVDPTPRDGDHPHFPFLEEF